MTTRTALFINGIFDGVLEEILKAQARRGGGEYYLHPFKAKPIVMLRKLQPSATDPVRLFMSTTKNLSQICYTAEIVGWEDKQLLTKSRRDELLLHFRSFQRGEVGHFEGLGEQGKKAVNLICIRGLAALDALPPTSILRKVSDGKPLRKRSRAGGWSEVYDLGDLLALPFATREQLDQEQRSQERSARALSDVEIADRLNAANRIPERIQVLSTGFRRNALVIESVLRRAQGFCERCKKPAPFKRATDGSPFLEIHHWTPLSRGGEDVVDNAAALCPNCHRQEHYGQTGEGCQN